MGNVVAARRIRKSMLKNNKVVNDYLGDINISGSEIKRKIREHEKEENINNDDNESTESKFFLKFKIKFMVQIIISINIVLISIILKLTFEEKILDNKYANVIINEYNKDYSKEGVIEKAEEYVKQSYNAGKYIIPENIANYVSSKYIEEIKPYLTKFELKEEILNVFNNVDKNIENTETNVDENKSITNINEGASISGAESIVEESNIVEGQLEEAISAISIMDNDVQEVLAKNIDIKLPTSGTITSRYGVRDEIFDNIDEYHTGIDIANKLNTEILSATDGVVIATENMNKYYGNNIEIENDGVIFKYAHLNKINVKTGDSIKQGDLIGLMGSTGRATGSHLHFEIKINNRTIDPEEILKF